MKNNEKKLQSTMKKINKRAVSVSNQEIQEEIAKKNLRKKRRTSAIKLYFISFFFTFILCAVVFAIVFFNSYQKPEKARNMVNTALEFYTNGEFDKALDIYNKALKYDPKNANAYIGIARCLSSMQKYDEAEAKLNQAINAMPTEAKLYAEMVAVYVKSNRPVEALLYLESIPDVSVKKNVTAKMPKTPSISPSNGSYSNPIEVVITKMSPDEKIYYSLDGSVPNLVEENLYKGSFVIDDGLVTLRAFSISPDGYISQELTASYSVYNQNEEYTFKDKGVEAMVRAQLNKPSGKITKGDLNKVLKLSSIGIKETISSLEDIIYIPNLSSLTIEDQPNIASLEPLSSLSLLTSLTLNNCNIDNSKLVNIASIQNLAKLTLNNNLISDLTPLTECHTLTSLYVSQNQLTNIADLSNLTNLSTLDVSNNLLLSVSNIPTATGLKILNISHNQITSLESLNTLTGLTSLDASYNLLTALDKIKNLTNLQTLNASNNSIISMSAIPSLYALRTLDLSNNGLTNISELNNISVNTLNLSNNAITDLNIELPFVTTFDLRNNLLTNVDKIALYSNITVLYISDNRITNIDALRACNTLKSIYCYNNLIEDISAFDYTSIKIYK